MHGRTDMGRSMLACMLLFMLLSLLLLLLSLLLLLLLLLTFLLLLLLLWLLFLLSFSLLLLSPWVGLFVWRTRGVPGSISAVSYVLFVVIFARSVHLITLHH